MIIGAAVAASAKLAVCNRSGVVEARDASSNSSGSRPAAAAAIYSSFKFSAFELLLPGHMLHSSPQFTKHGSFTLTPVAEAHGAYSPLWQAVG